MARKKSARQIEMDKYYKKLAAWQKDHDLAVGRVAEYGKKMRTTGANQSIKQTDNNGKTYSQSISIPTRNKYADSGMTPSWSQRKMWNTFDTKVAQNDRSVASLEHAGVDVSGLKQLDPRRKRGAVVDAAKSASALDVAKMVGKGIIRPSVAVLTRGGAAMEAFNELPKFIERTGVYSGVAARKDAQKVMKQFEVARDMGGMSKQYEDTNIKIQRDSLIERGVNPDTANDVAEAMVLGDAEASRRRSARIVDAVSSGKMGWSAGENGKAGYSDLLSTFGGVVSGKKGGYLPSNKYRGSNINKIALKNTNAARSNPLGLQNYDIDINWPGVREDINRAVFAAPQTYYDVVSGDAALNALKFGSGAAKSGVVNKIVREAANLGDELKYADEAANVAEYAAKQADKAAIFSDDIADVARADMTAEQAYKARTAADAARTSSGKAIKDIFDNPKEYSTFLSELGKRGYNEVASMIDDGTMRVGDLLDNKEIQREVNNAAIRASKDYGLVTSFGKTYGGGIRRMLGRSGAAQALAEGVKNVRGSQIAQMIPFLGTQDAMYKKAVGDISGGVISTADRERAATMRALESNKNAAIEATGETILEDLKRGLNPWKNQKNFDHLMSLISLESDKTGYLVRSGALGGDVRGMVVDSVYDKLTRSGRIAGLSKDDIATVFDRMNDAGTGLADVHSDIAIRNGMGDLIDTARNDRYAPVMRADQSRTGINKDVLNTYYGIGDKYIAPNRTRVIKTDMTDAASQAIENERKYPTILDAIIGQGNQRGVGGVNDATGSNFELNSLYGLQNRIEQALKVSNDDLWRARVGRAVEGRAPQGTMAQYEFQPTQPEWMKALGFEFNPNEAKVAGNVDWRDPEAADDIFAQSMEPVQSETSKSQFLRDLGIKPKTERAYQSVDDARRQFGDDAAGLGLGRTSSQHEVRGGTPFWTERPKRAGEWRGANRVPEMIDNYRDGLYHVTGNAEAVDRTGILRSGEELQKMGVETSGLGGTPQYISTTFNNQHADLILERMNMMKSAANGEIGYDDAKRYAEKILDDAGYASEIDNVEQRVAIEATDDWTREDYAAELIRAADATAASKGMVQPAGAYFIPDYSYLPTERWSGLDPKKYNLLAPYRNPITEDLLTNENLPVEAFRSGGNRDMMRETAAHDIVGELETRFDPTDGGRPVIRGGKEPIPWSTDNTPAFARGEFGTRGYGVSSKVGGIRPVDAETFASELAKTNPEDGLHQYSVDELAGMETFLDPDTRTGFAIKPSSLGGEGDYEIVALFRNGDTKGSGMKAMDEAIRIAEDRTAKAGGKNVWLDAYDKASVGSKTSLADMYAGKGFSVSERSPWNPEYANDVLAKKYPTVGSGYDYISMKRPVSSWANLEPQGSEQLPTWLTKNFPEPTSADISIGRRYGFNMGGHNMGATREKVLRDLVSPETFAGVYRNQALTAGGEMMNEALMPLMTVMRPAFTAKNWMGNVANTYLTGNLNGAEQTRAAMDVINVLRNRGVTTGLANEAELARAVESGAMNLPAYNPTAMFREGTNASHAIYQNKATAPIYNFAQSLSSSVESQGRLPLYRQFMAQGMDSDTALQNVNKVLYDYELSSLNRGEQAIKKYMPFLTYNRRNIPFQIEQALTRPAYVPTQSRLLNAIDPNFLNNQSEQSKFSQKRNSTTVRVGDSYVNIPLPISEPLNQLNSLSEYANDVRNNGFGDANLSPLADILDTGMSPGVKAEASLLSALAAGTAGSATEAKDEALRSVPIAGSIASGLKRAKKEEGLGGDPSAMPRVMWNLMSGLSSEHYDPDSALRERIYQRADAVKAATDKYTAEHNGKSVPSIKDIRDEQMALYNQDPVNYKVPAALRDIVAQPPVPIQGYNSAKQSAINSSAYITYNYGDYLEENYPDALRDDNGYFTMKGINKLQMERNRKGLDWDKNLPWMQMVSTYSKQQQARKKSSTAGMKQYYNDKTGRKYYAPKKK